MRDAIGFWIEQCPRCGYCAPDIVEGSPQSVKVVATRSYREQHQSNDFPNLTNAFLCYSLIAEQDGNFEAAGWACLHGAWVCDDYGAVLAAQHCRRQAVAFFELAHHHQQEFASSPELEEAVIVDLLRRAGDFSRAMAVCRDTLNRDVQAIDATIVSMLRFQEVLILRQDTESHWISEAIGHGV